MNTYPALGQPQRGGADARITYRVSRHAGLDAHPKPEAKMLGACSFQVSLLRILSRDSANPPANVTLDS